MAKVKHYKIVTDPGSWDISSWYGKQKAGNKFDLILTGTDGTPHALDAVKAAELTAALAGYAALAGTNAFTGANSFSTPVTVATPTANEHATTKIYVDTADAALQSTISALAILVNNGVQRPTAYDMELGTKNYPAATEGQTFRIINAVKGTSKIGGASGRPVENGDTVIAIANSAGGTEASVGANYYILNANIDLATETTDGTIRKATNAEADGLSSDVGAMTPAKTSRSLDAAAVRFDKAQSLTSPQQAQARANIGAGAPVTPGNLGLGAGLTFSSGNGTGKLLGANATISLAYNGLPFSGTDQSVPDAVFSGDVDTFIYTGTSVIASGATGTKPFAGSTGLYSMKTGAQTGMRLFVGSGTDELAWQGRTSGVLGPIFRAVSRTFLTTNHYTKTETDGLLATSGEWSLEAW